MWNKIFYWSRWKNSQRISTKEIEYNYWWDVKMAEQKRFVQYMCRYCGAKETKSISFGRPMPGKCPRKKNGGPHSWVVNKRY
jgi:ribosomal protein L40E